MPFIFGFLAAAIALVLQLVVWLFFPPLFEVQLPLTATVLFSILLLALIEESIRYLFSRRYLQQFGTPSLLFIVLFWIGFVAPEIILGVWQSTIALPFLAPLFLHATLTWILFFGLQRKEVVRGTLLLGLVGLHLLGNIVFLVLL